MMILRIILLSFLCFFTVLVAASDQKNMIYIVMEGVSRDSLYSLLQKNRLKHISEIISVGNYRNLEVEGIEVTYEDTYLTMLTGYDHHELAISSQNYTADKSFFEQIKQLNQDYTTALLFTPKDIQNKDSVVFNLMQELVDLNKSFSRIKSVSSYELGLEAANVIKHMQSPFVLFLNFTNVDRVGQRYREGGELYSQAILNCDRAIGLILKQLSEQDILKNTQILITTNYGMQSKSKFKSHLTWVLSNKKTQRKGVIQDIVPSLYDLLGLSPKRDQYFGESIFK